MGAILDRLTLGPGGSGDDSELDFVKNYLRVPHEADDDLITALIAAAKSAADDYCQNAFEADRTQIVVSGAQVADCVDVNGITFRLAATAPADSDRDWATGIMDYAIGADDEETADNLAAQLNDPSWGCREVRASALLTVVTLNWRLVRAKPVPATEWTERLDVLLTRVEVDIPQTVATGVLQCIARWYEQRVDGVASEAISGSGTQTFGAPSIAQALWAPYRVNPGL